MKIVGLTGNIATGKSTVAAIFKNLGAQIIDADKIAREIVDKDKPALIKIVNHFGAEVINPDGTLNRELLGNVIFNDDKKREELNKITHPEIFKEINGLIDKYRSDNKEVVIIEAALIIEREKLKQLIDKLIVVNASINTQIKRLKSRNNYTRSEALSRINSQMPTEEKIKHADFVVNNDKDIKDVEKQVKAIWAQIS